MRKTLLISEFVLGIKKLECILSVLYELSSPVVHLPEHEREKYKQNAEGRHPLVESATLHRKCKTS